MAANQRAYDEAMLLPQVRLHIPEADIVQGSVEKMTIVTGQGTYQRPWGQNGQFAVVYKFRTLSGQTKALRCFRVAMQANTGERYEHLSRYFRTHASTITAGFRYYDDGILVNEQVRGKSEQRAHAVIVMDWINGTTLLDKIHALCREQDRDGLQSLAERWLDLLDTMQEASIAHGDLSGCNVMVRNNGHLVLIDYDGVYIPPFAGMAPIVDGQADYQHPQGKGRPFDERMDHFSAYVIYIALRALGTKPSLWENYAPQGRDGTIIEDRLLFSKQDFLDPDRSTLFAELEQIHDPLLTAILGMLKMACKQAIEQIVLPPLGKALVHALHTACQQGSFSHKSQEDLQQIELVVTYEQLKEAIHRHIPREIIRLSHKLERATNVPLAKKSIRTAVSEAKQQFIASAYTTQVQAQIAPSSHEVSVEWQWPDDELVRWAAIAWRGDKWPSHPHEKGTYLYHPVERQGNEQRGFFRFTVSPQSQCIYLQIFFALPEYTANRGVTWCYSNSANSPTSRYQLL